MSTENFVMEGRGHLWAFPICVKRREAALLISSPSHYGLEVLCPLFSHLSYTNDNVDNMVKMSGETRYAPSKGNPKWQQWQQWQQW